MSQNSDNDNDPARIVRSILQTAEEQASRAGLDAPDPDIDSRGGFDDEGEPGTGPRGDGAVDLEAVHHCAALDHSDTDNAERLLTHFGADLLVLAQEKARAALYVVWDGKRWDTGTGGPRALAIAQKVGGRIALEAQFLTYTPPEAKAVEAAAKAKDLEPSERNDEDRERIKLGVEAEKALTARIKRRMNHAVTSKNKGRLEAMLACAAPHAMRSPDAFNADHLKVATRSHTLTFSKVIEQRENPAWSDPDNASEDVPKFISAVTGSTIDVHHGHRREDLITDIVPVDYDPEAQCPLWEDFLAEFLPQSDVRRLVQVASGLGLLGLTVQRLFFHYGSGANGKSVFMETCCRVLGEVAVTLPAESFFGDSKGAGGASPDIARLFGRRFLRVQELPEGEAMREDLVKRLTGGEDFPVRDLFQGYFDFKPLFTGHMSGNGFPKITGTDNGIWRRMAVIHWPVTIPEDRQRDFEDVLSDFRPEYPGILNWMVEGALIYLREGLVIPDAVRQKTQEYRDEMDRTSAFCAECIADAPGEHVQAKALFDAYQNWCVDAARSPMSMTAFGKAMKRKYNKQEGRVNRYLDIKLVNLPAQTYGGKDDFEDHLR